MDDFDPTKPIGRDNFPMFTATRGGIQYRRDTPPNTGTRQRTLPEMLTALWRRWRHR